MSKTFTITRGTSFTIGVNYQKDGEPKSLIGSTIRFTVKPTEYDDSADDSTAILKKDVTDGNANGYAEIIIAPEDTKELTVGEYTYDLKVDELSDFTLVYKIAEGKVVIDGSPTNRSAGE